MDYRYVDEKNEDKEYRAVLYDCNGRVVVEGRNVVGFVK